MLKQLMGYIQEYRKYFILAPLLVVGEAIAELVLPYLMGRIVDVGVAEKDIPYMFLIGGVMIVVAVLGIFVGVYAAKYSAKASQGFGYNLRQAIFRKVQTFSFADVDKFSTASLVTRCTTDVKQLQQTVVFLLSRLQTGGKVGVVLRDILGGDGLIGHGAVPGNLLKEVVKGVCGDPGGVGGIAVSVGAGNAAFGQKPLVRRNRLTDKGVGGVKALGFQENVSGADDLQVGGVVGVFIVGGFP